VILRRAVAHGAPRGNTTTFDDEVDERTLCMPQKSGIGNESAPIQLAQCRFPR